MKMVLTEKELVVIQMALAAVMKDTTQTNEVRRMADELRVKFQSVELEIK